MVLWGRSLLSHQDVPWKVPPRLRKFRGVCGLLQRIRLGLPKGSVLKGSLEGSPRIHQGFTEVPPRFQQLLGQIRLGVPKGSVQGSPHHFCKPVSQFLKSCLHFSRTALGLGPYVIVKSLGQNDSLVFWGSLQQMVLASQTVLWSVPRTVLFWANGCCFREGSVEGSAN